MEACCASKAWTPPRSSEIGEATCFQCVPPSVVRRSVPALPTIQQTLSAGAEPARRSAATPLSCGFHVLPASLECSILPASPTRQACFLFGETIEVATQHLQHREVTPVHRRLCCADFDTLRYRVGSGIFALLFLRLLHVFLFLGEALVRGLIGGLIRSRIRGLIHVLRHVLILHLILHLIRHQRSPGAVWPRP